MSGTFKGGEESDKKFLFWLNDWMELSSDGNMLLRLSADCKLSSCLFSLTHLTGWRRSQRRRPGWCAVAGCVRCYWWRRRWRRRATRPWGRAWRSAPSLKDGSQVSANMQLIYVNSKLRNIHGENVTYWECWLCFLWWFLFLAQWNTLTPHICPSLVLRERQRGGGGGVREEGCQWPQGQRSKYVYLKDLRLNSKDKLQRRVRLR